MSRLAEPKRIAVVGGGIAGMGAAWQLASVHEVTLLESGDYVGGHANTVDVNLGGRVVPVDTGFIVFNDRNYPNLTALFKKLEVPVADSDMSFGVSLGNGAFEYSGSDLPGLFAQPSNLFKPTFWQMLADIKRFYANAPVYLVTLDSHMSISNLLEAERYSEVFIENHLMPMAAAIWSASRADIAHYPAQAFIRFFENHGLLTLTDRPQWQTVRGGSREYISRLLRNRSIAVKKNTRVSAITRRQDRVMIADQHGHCMEFDEVVLATHADQALALLRDASPLERRALGAFKYSANTAWLHQDTALMPRRQRAWSSWNYLQTSPDPTRPLAVTYWMNRLQPLPTNQQLFVTLNPASPPKAALTHGEFAYEHPVFTAETARARDNIGAAQGVQHTWFCGAYLGHGFHEDGLQSGLWVASQLGAGDLLAQPCFDRLPDGFQQRLAAAA